MWTVSLALVSMFFLRAEASAPSMTVYAMAVGQGDANIIACPNGRDILIVDMGANYPLFTTREYGTYLLKEKFGVLKENKSIHILVSHPHNDHYNQLKTAIDDELISRVSEIVISGKPKKYSSYFVEWLNQKGVPTYTINNGEKCFGNEQCVWTKADFSNETSNRQSKRLVSVDQWQFCGSDVDITVLGANIRYTSNLNMLSVVIKLVYNKWSLLMSGDLEGVGVQMELIKQWSSSGKLQSTYYKVAHHGSWTDDFRANLPDLLAEIRPKCAYVSQGYPSLSEYRHPNCTTIEHLIAVGSIDKVASGVNTPFVCWNHTLSPSPVYALPEGLGYAIYETCSGLSNDGKQKCRDIMIETDGISDKTQYVEVPPKYIRK